MPKLKVVLLIVVVGALALGAAAYGVRLVMKWRAAQDVMPTFTEPPPGPHAPTARFMGVDLGTSTLPAVQALIAQTGATCRDSSARAILEGKRERTRAEIERRTAAGESVDGVTGASLINHRSKLERNPQVRLSCEATRAPTIPDRARVEGVGRWLFVFDSPRHPLRHVSYRRSVTDQAQARAELEAATAAVAAALGPPTRTTGTLDAGEAPFGLMKPYNVVWQFADVKAEVSVLNMGGRGIDMNEAYEVPWPVRADAPRLPPTVGAPPP